MPPDCTHADAGEARERAHRGTDAAWLRYVAADDYTPAEDAAWREFDDARTALENFTPCPDCGRWREGANG
ncbi:MAG TPA: hypothetical protein VGD74_09745 [Vulgatibacter sp.]